MSEHSWTVITRVASSSLNPKEFIRKSYSFFWVLRWYFELVLEIMAVFWAGCIFDYYIIDVLMICIIIAYHSNLPSNMTHV